MEDEQQRRRLECHRRRAWRARMCDVMKIDAGCSVHSAGACTQSRTRHGARSAGARAYDVINCCGGVVVVGGVRRRARGQASDRNGGVGGVVHVSVAYTGGSRSPNFHCNNVLFHIACQQLNTSAAEHCSNGTFKAVDML